MVKGIDQFRAHFEGFNDRYVLIGGAADYDADGRLAGIEILDAVKRLGDPQVFRQVILEDIALGKPEQPSV